MVQSKLEAKTPDGTMEVHLHAPEGPGPFPTVILFFDAGGVRKAMHDAAERLAAAGYLVAIPNYFYRAGEFAPFDLATVWGDPEERARIMSLVMQAVPHAATDTQAVLAALDAEPRAQAQKVGLVGYCMGGRMAFSVASSLAERVAAAAPIHAGHIATDDPSSPHRGASKIRGALYFGVADDDASCTPAHQATLRAALDEAGIPYELELHEGAKHGFAVNDSHAYDATAAERQWEKVLALFGRTLSASSAS